MNRAAPSRRLVMLILLPLSLVAPNVLAAPAKDAKDAAKQLDLPDRPGAVRVVRPRFDPVRAAQSKLPKFTVEVSGGRTIGRARPARFTVVAERETLRGRVDLARLDATSSTKTSAARPVRLFLHGQGRETFSLPPGRYRLSLAFWRARQPFPLPYPHTRDFTIRPGQTATLTLTRRQCGAIKKWLGAQEIRTRSETPPKGKTAGEFNQ